METAWLQKIGGIELIKNALIDDCELAKAVKTGGGRIWLGLGLKSRSIRPYTFRDFWSTVARTAFTQLKYSTLLLLAAVIALGLVFLAPPALALVSAAHGQTYTLLSWAGVWGIMVVLYAPTLRLYNLNPLRGIFLPVIAFLYMAMTIHSAIRYGLGRGGKWKDRIYDFKK